MFNLRSIYFYFFAILISLIKFFKKIYFTTNLYNKSLISKTPQQFYFYPNPILLSLITNFKNHLFKIKDFNPNIFWGENKNIQEEKNLHSFVWLNLIDRKNDGKSIQKIINLWILRNSNYKKNLWESSVLSKRIISWILNSEIILTNGLFEFKRGFFNSIISQTTHLKKNIKFEKDNLKKIEILTALLLSGLVFKEYDNNFKIALKELEKLVKKFFDVEGFPLSRNPSDLVFVLKHLVICKECIKDAQQYLPEFLEIIIKNNIECLNNILTPNHSIPLFNGGIEENLEELTKFEKKLDYKSKSDKNLSGGIQILKQKNNLVFFDVGQPPSKQFSSKYQSGPLSFEYYLEGKKIITNCGFGSNISPKAELLSRLTSAQSTVTLDDISVTKFEKNKMINKIFGNSIKDSFKINELKYIDEGDYLKSVASHNGYEKKLGCIHRREISINKASGQLSGYDTLVKKQDGKPVNFYIRFHLSPDLTAVRTMGGNSVLFQLSKNKSLIFVTNSESIILEKGIFFGGNKILDNTCVTIFGNLVNKSKTIHWEIKKNI